MKSYIPLVIRMELRKDMRRPKLRRSYPVKARYGIGYWHNHRGSKPHMRASILTYLVKGDLS